MILIISILKIKLSALKIVKIIVILFPLLYSCNHSFIRKYENYGHSLEFKNDSSFLWKWTWDVVTSHNDSGFTYRGKWRKNMDTLFLTTTPKRPHKDNIMYDYKSINSKYVYLRIFYNEKPIQRASFSINNRTFNLKSDSDFYQ